MCVPAPPKPHQNCPPKLAARRTKSIAFRRKYFVLSSNVSLNEYLRGQADVAHLDPLAVVALRTFGFVLRDLPKPRRQPFRVQVRCIFPSYPLFCAQEQSCDFLSCGQEEGEVARNRASWRFVEQLRLRYVSGKVVTSTAVHGVRSRACGCSSGQRRPLCRGLLRDGGEFDFPLVCMLV